MKKFILLFILILASILRLWKISQVPVSLFGDELDVGYQAYSIFKTGRDYMGNAWPIHFHSLAEWRTPLYIYSAVPTVALFGISPLGVRLPVAFFGVLGVLSMYLLIKEISSERLGLFTSGLLSISPWHLQYSRAGFEVTLLLFLLLLGLYFFFRGLKNGKLLWLSALCLALTPWVYSTAKLFTPLLLIFLFFAFRKEIIKIPILYTLYAILTLIIVGTPITVSTIYGGGAERFSYISIFTDPTTEPEVGTSRQIDARVRGEQGEGLTPNLLDRAIHNKFTFWGENILKNYFQAFSTEFLFIKGDLNLRHSIGIGEFYRVEVIALIVGIILFFAPSVSPSTMSSGPNSSGQNAKMKWLMAFWVLAGVVPSAITREGGRHASRLILILPPLIFLISYGILETTRLLKGRLRFLFLTSYIILLTSNIFFYQHSYWVHYPRESERWWHSGFKESFAEIKKVENNYDKIIISMAGEPAWIFFAGHYMYPPNKWQSEFPIGNDIDVPGFGKISHTGKFYFGSPSGSGGIYGLANNIDNKTLYLAVAKEVGANLILEPARVPSGLRLLKAIPYPSGEPAFYIFTKSE